MGNFWGGRPYFKSGLEGAIYNGSAQIPIELVEHQYRKLFNLSSKELFEEPADVVLLSLEIESMLRDKEAKEAKWQQRT